MCMATLQGKCSSRKETFQPGTYLESFKWVKLTIIVIMITANIY